MAAARIERLMNLVALLSDTRTPKTLREIIAVIPGYPDALASARRAFERDKEELRAMNFDVAVEESPNGESGYKISRDSTYYDVELSSSQRSIVEYALSLYGPEKTVASRALTKLGGMNPENEMDNVTVLPMPDGIDQLYIACSQKSNVVITFKGNQRRLNAKRIIARGGYWYLEAHDFSKGEDRTFRIDRITNIEISDGEVSSQETESTHDEDVDTCTFKVRTHPALVPRFTESWSGIHDPKTGLITFTVPRKEIFQARIHEYAGFVTIVEPREAADEVAALYKDAISELKAGV